MERITSRSNGRIKDTVRLRDRKVRTETGLFFYEGVHLTEEYLRFRGIPETVFVTDRAAVSYGSLLSRLPGDRLISVTDEVYGKLTGETSPQGILCVCRLPRISTSATEGGGVLFLESVRDTGNLGTVIRTAAALGVRSVVLSSDCADLYSPKTLRASMGAVFSANIAVAADFKAEITRAAGFGKVYASALHDDSVSIGSFRVMPEDSFVIGNEGQGVSPEVKELCCATAVIPMTERAESLNVSAAAAIIMWEMTHGR